MNTHNKTVKTTAALKIGIWFIKRIYLNNYFSTKLVARVTGWKLNFANESAVFANFANAVPGSVLSGVNTWQLLQASTINAAKVLAAQNEWGSIAEGKIANMVLLNAYPLDGLANRRKIDWIINKGVALKPDSVRK